MRPKRQLLEIAGVRKAIQITDDHSRTLIDPVSGVAFHSASGALAETRHVYLNNSGVKQRLAQGETTAVLEVGLGTGLGMLLTVDEAHSGNAKLDYHAFELELLPTTVLRALELQCGLKSPAVCESYFDWYEKSLVGVDRGSYRWECNAHVAVTIHHQDAREVRSPQPAGFDAIYFDPFSPAVNQELWTEEFLSRMWTLLRDGGQLVTYCVNRRVKDALTVSGFEIECLRGPVGGKREVMRATRRG